MRKWRKASRVAICPRQGHKPSAIASDHAPQSGPRKTSCDGHVGAPNHGRVLPCERRIDARHKEDGHGHRSVRQHRRVCIKCVGSLGKQHHWDLNAAVKVLPQQTSDLEGETGIFKAGYKWEEKEAVEQKACSCWC
jgi:hypothetical protein